MAGAPLDSGGVAETNLAFGRLEPLLLELANVSNAAGIVAAGGDLWATTDHGRGLAFFLRVHMAIHTNL